MNLYTAPNPSVAPILFSDRIWRSLRHWLSPSSPSGVDRLWFPDTNSDPIINLEGEGIVDRPITPYGRGRVYYQGSWWPATCTEDAPLLTGQVVRVIARQNITLLVTPMASSLEWGIGKPQT